jgi:hypothetical protein
MTKKCFENLISKIKKKQRRPEPEKLFGNTQIVTTKELQKEFL